MGRRRTHGERLLAPHFILMQIDEGQRPQGPQSQPLWANHAQLSVYGALRSSDGKVTVMGINMTYRDLTFGLNLASLR